MMEKIEVWYNRDVIGDMYVPCEVMECSKFEINYETKSVYIFGEKGFAPWDYDITEIWKIYHLTNSVRYLYYENLSAKPTDAFR